MSANAGKPAPGNRPPEPPEMTRLESDDEIRRAIQARRARAAVAKAPPAKGKPASPLAPTSAEAEPEPDRPQLRPPMALLGILDDGKSDGEWVRLRSDRCVIGRTEGDVRILHDAVMSGRHAEIVRQKGVAGYRWLLTDLQSTNGTFVRVGSTILRPQSELLIGRARYRFEAAAEIPTTAEPLPADGSEGETQSWAGGPVAALVPSLVEITPGGPGQRFALTLPEYAVGRDATACRIARPDDPLLNARHARLYRDSRGQWHIENNKSLNGIWLRVEQIPLDRTCQFRLGEQRFLFRLL